LIDGQNVALGTEKFEITDSSVGIFISFNLWTFTMTCIMYYGRVFLPCRRFLHYIVLVVQCIPILPFL
jgi:hypothetical protein